MWEWVYARSKNALEKKCSEKKSENMWEWVYARSQNALEKKCSEKVMETCWNGYMRGGNFTARRESRNVWVSEENQNSIEKSSY